MEKTQTDIIVLVCGGRDFGLRDMDEAEFIFTTLHKVNDEHKIKKVVHGAAKGVDTVAGAWASVNNIPVQEYPANWKKFGKSAGHRRNAEMLQKEDVNLVIAFPGGIGTEGMVHQALANNIEVLKVEV